MRKSIVWLLALLLAVMLLAGCGPKKTEAPEEDIPTLQELQDATVDSTETLQLRDTLVYYSDSDSLVVPVISRIPWEDGIAKATLSRMVESEGSLVRAGAMGLQAPIPANTKFDINIKDGIAVVNLSKEVLSCKNAAQEQAMITAIVNTLVEFPAIQQVQFMVDGKKASTLPHGTDVSKPMNKQALNLEADGIDTELATADQVIVYYTGGEGDYLVPVTRLVNGPASVEAAAREWVKGPKTGKLKACLPEGCKLNQVTLKDGLATFDFSKEFNQLSQNTALEKHALKALYLMCQAFDEVKSVLITVEGSEYIPADVANMAAPTFANIE